MSKEFLSFADLIAPVTPEAFFGENWEAQPLYVRRSDQGFYENLLTNRDLEKVISSGGLRYPSIQLAKGGGLFPPEAFTRSIRSGGDIFTGVPDIARVNAEFAAGSSIVLPGFQRAWKTVRDLTERLEDYFDHPIHANAYITPKGAAGFTPHYDTHEVFILQIAGNKHWRVYEPPLTLPHRSQPFAPNTYSLPAKPVLELDIAPGDLLYLPRGYVHTTTTSQAASMHLTVGVTVYTWIELAAELLQACKDDVRLRKALPPGFASRAEAKTVLQKGLRGLLDDLATAADQDLVGDRFINRVRISRTKAVEFCADIAATERIVR